MFFFFYFLLPMYNINQRKKNNRCIIIIFIITYNFSAKYIKPSYVKFLFLHKSKRYEVKSKSRFNSIGPFIFHQWFAVFYIKIFIWNFWNTLFGNYPSHIVLKMIKYLFISGVKNTQLKHHKIYDGIIR